MSLAETTVVVVRHVSECDVEPVPGLIPMPYSMAVDTLRMMYRAKRSQLRSLDLVYAQADGTLGRYASWVL